MIIKHFLLDDEPFETILFSYTGSAQVWNVPKTTVYKIECWGARSGLFVNADNTIATTAQIYAGGYVSGNILLLQGTILRLYIGGVGANRQSHAGSKPPLAPAAFNGGGIGGTANQNYLTRGRGAGGGGGTDVRLDSSLNSRIIVAGGSGGVAGAQDASRSHAGGLNGYDGWKDAVESFASMGGRGGTQSSGGTGGTGGGNFGTEPAGTNGVFGVGGNGGTANRSEGGGGGGGGYFGGGGGGGASNGGGGTGGGGSSYISGHAGCRSMTSSTSTSTGTSQNHYSGLVFTNTIMIDGLGYRWTTAKGSLLAMPNPLGGNYASGVGHQGAGYIRISEA